jgi:hypothetical protein
MSNKQKTYQRQTNSDGSEKDRLSNQKSEKHMGGSTEEKRRTPRSMDI